MNQRGSQAGDAGFSKNEGSPRLPVDLTTAVNFGLVFLALSLLALAGCCMRKPPTARPPYSGPTLTMRQLAEKEDEKNRAIPSVFSHLFFNGEVFDDKGRRHALSGDGVLVYRRPQELLLRANGPLGPVFEVGSTSDMYWLKVVPEVEKMWYGHYAKSGAETRGLPIRPDLVLEVLGVGEIDENFLQHPVPTLRVDADEYAYDVVWNARLPDRWAAQKEIWYDLVTLQPRRILIYDANGRVTLRAELSKPTEIGPGPSTPKGMRPKMASHFELLFPDTKAHLTFDLTDPLIQNAKGIPKEGTIKFPDLSAPGVANEPILLDSPNQEGEQGPR